MNRTPFTKGLGFVLFCLSGLFFVVIAVAPVRAQTSPSRPSPTLMAQASPSQTPLVPGSSVPGSSVPGSGSASSPSTSTVSSYPDLQHRGVDIESSQPDAHEQYLLGGGDEVVVTVLGRPELSGTHIIGPDGRITLPVGGPVDLGDKSRDEAAAAIDDALGKYYTGKMSSTVQVIRYGSNHILLLGAVQHPGLINFDQPPTLLEVITQGGPLAGAKGGGTPKRCIVFRGKDQVMKVDIADRLDGQKALNDIRLRRNDTVYVPADQQSLVSVLGQVAHPGPVELTPRTTLVSLLADSGGITPQAGNPEILIVEPSTGRRQQVKFKELLKLQGGADITLHDGDIVYVPRSGLATLGFTLQQISPVTQVGSIVSYALH